MSNSCSNQNPCPCPGEKCASKGRCCECIIKHKKAGNVPYCLRETVEEMCKRAILREKEKEQAQI